jgi:serine/threonine protein kinase
VRLLGSLGNMGADLAPEEHFGPYLVFERLGVGGMATVHRALQQGDSGLERVVALKRLLPHLAEDASFIKSFVREAKLASLLSHVNIVQIYELGRVGSEYFITMEYIDGRDVRQVLRHARKVSGPPPLHVTIGVLLQLADALDYAHNKVDEDGHPLGLVHRDVSPSNLLVTSAGHLKVIDFGIAKAQSSQLRTQTGRVKGKLAYMAPEAVSGSKDLDARSDLWAAGVILHELLTARPLFASKNEYQTLLKVQRGDIMPPSTFNQACPPEVDAIVLKALARDPDNRFARASDLRDELIAVRKQYGLATGFRDIAGWIDWAFALEQPGQFSGAHTTGVSSVHSVVRHKTPRPPRDHEEDEAVELVWGTGELRSESGPLLLEDVPDVSGKVPMAQGSNELDDIPTPQPSHGAPSSRFSAIDTGGLPPKNIDPALSAGTDPPRPRGSSKLVAQRGTGPFQPIRQSDRMRTPTSPGPGVGGQRERVATDPDSSSIGDATDPQLVNAAATDPTMSPVDDDDTIDVDDLPEFPDDSAPTTTSSKKRSQPEDAVSIEQPTPVPMLDSPHVSVRFKHTPSGPFPAIADPTRPPPTTKPGMGRMAIPRPTAPVDLTTDAAPRAKRPSDITVGAGLLERNRSKRGWVIVVALVLAAAGAAAIVLATRDRGPEKHAPDKPPMVQARSTATLKLITEPADAEIKIEGQTPHAGSPWATELSAGTYQVEIHRTGYKAWLTSVELSAAENQTLRVVLEPLDKTEADSASLAISTTPTGLEVVIDGKPAASKTPLKATIKAGSHVIVVRQNGVEVWRQSLKAEANSDYEFNPSFTADKQRERAARGTAPTVGAPKAPANKSKPDVAEAPPEQAPEPPATKIESPSEKPPTAPAVLVTPPAPTPPPAPAPAPAPHPAAPVGPVNVAPGAVKRLSGETPDIQKSKYTELPSVIAVKVCIDTTGNVTTVSMLTKVDHRTESSLESTLKNWKYAPYKRDNVATPACFSVPFRIQ